MSLPQPYREAAPPPIVDGRGDPLGAANLDAPNWPGFIRAVLVGTRYEANHPGWGSPPPIPPYRKKLHIFPRWVLYGGPMRRSQYQEALTLLQRWAFEAKLGDEAGFFVVAEWVPIHPDLPASRWPAKASFQWKWAHEPSPPARWRLVWTPEKQSAFWQATSPAPVSVV